jgi:hypothetical protein
MEVAMATTDYQYAALTGTAPRTRTIPMAVPILTALSFVVAGLLFVLYPALRPFSDEVSMDGAAAFASTNWILAHSIAIAGFILLGLGLLGAFEILREGRVARASGLGLVSSWIGISLTLPYYGAEVFGLHAVGRAVVDRGDISLMSTVGAIRWDVGIWFILAGLIALAIGTVLVAIGAWRAETIGRWGPVLLAVAFVLYIPQFAGPQVIRVAHGLLVLVGCWLIARGIFRHATGMDAAAPAR